MQAYVKLVVQLDEDGAILPRLEYPDRSLSLPIVKLVTSCGLVYSTPPSVNAITILPVATANNGTTIVGYVANKSVSKIDSVVINDIKHVMLQDGTWMNIDLLMQDRPSRPTQNSLVENSSPAARLH